MRYQLKAIGPAGGVESIDSQAPDETTAVRQLEGRGYTVLSVRAKHTLGAPWGGRSQRFPLALFSQELRVLINAGLPLVEAIDTLGQKERSNEWRGVIERLVAVLKEGQPLSAALEQFPQPFSPLYVATVKASEKTSDLAPALARYVAYAGQLESIRKRVVNASIYPMLLIAVGGMVGLFLLLYVVPRFGHIYAERGTDLPLFSRLLLSWGNAVDKHGLVVLGALALLVAGIVYALRLPQVRTAIGDALWRVPAIGERLKIYQLARFYRTIGMLLRGGMPLVAALDMGAELLHPMLRARLAAASRAISEGRNVSQSMDANGLTTSVALRMLAVGEKGGNMGEMLEQIAASLHLECLPMAELRRAAPAFDLLPFAECSQHSCALLRAADGRLLLAFDDPFSGELQAWAEERIEAAFSWCLVHRGDLVAFLAGHEESLRALDAVQEEVVRGPADSGRIEDLSLKSIGDESSEVVRLVRSTLRDALMIGASDVHLETQPAGLAIKFRTDGILSQVKMIQDTAQAEQAIARVKVLAELDITERRVPQDGRFKALEHGRAVDFRVSIMPSIHGEDAVLRVLDKQSLYETTHQQLSLDSLGFDAEDVRRLRRLSNEPYGMLLVTGPTGSGKTTTLYAAISEINNGQDKIVTIEDPVEYQLPGVLQIPVNEKKGLSFARGLRSILRHDPDKIMVGEIRDPETANIAVQSALTGHLVFTTVHANNVFDVIGRFVHMNVDLYGFVSALNAILAQRLVRVVCPHCAEDDQPSAEQLVESGLDKTDTKGWTFRVGRGCRECRGAGYKGRKAIAELMILTDELRELITSRAPVRQLKEAAHRSGTRFLRDAAFEAVRKGETTLQEINRVTFVS